MKSILLFLSLYLAETVAFSECSRHRRVMKQEFSASSSSALNSFLEKMQNDPSYSDNFLLNFHNQAQDEMQTETNSLKIWNEEMAKEQLSVKAWQDAFQINGLADFTPPMSAGLNCLMVGAPEAVDGTKLPWEDEAEATVTPMRLPKEATPVMDITTTTIVDDAIIDVSDIIHLETDHIPEPPADIVVSADTSLPKRATAATSKTTASLSKAGPTPAASYDCIVDNGLLDSVVALEDPAAIQELLVEAATAIREFGIYVYVSETLLSTNTKRILQEASDLAGLEWEFELDGLLETGEIVSVARRYNTGELPSMGKLSRFQV